MKLFSISAVALAAALPMAATAQTATTTTTTEVPAATVTTPAATAAAPAAAPTTTVVVPVVIQHLEDAADDAKVTAVLTEAGYKDVKLTRDGTKLTIDATKDGTAVNLVYDTTTGALTMVDGAGYTVPATAPGVQTGDKSQTGKTDQNGSSTPETGGSTGGTTGGATDGSTGTTGGSALTRSPW